MNGSEVWKISSSILSRRTKEAISRRKELDSESEEWKKLSIIIEELLAAREEIIDTIDNAMREELSK